MIDIPELISHVLHFVTKIDLLTNTKRVNKTFQNLTDHELSKRVTTWETTLNDFTSLQPQISRWSFSALNRYHIDHETGLFFHLSIEKSWSSQYVLEIEMSHVFLPEKSINLYSITSSTYYQFYLTEIPERLSKTGNKVKLMMFQLNATSGISIDYSNINNITKTMFDSDIPRQLFCCLLFKSPYWAKENQVYQKYLNFDTYQVSEQFVNDYEYSTYFHYCFDKEEYLFSLVYLANFDYIVQIIMKLQNIMICHTTIVFVLVEW
jgi:hypothetical protein